MTHFSRSSYVGAPKVMVEHHDVSRRLAQVSSSIPEFSSIFQNSRISVYNSLDRRERIKGFNMVKDIRARFSTTGILSDNDRALIKEIFEESGRNILEGLRSPDDHEFDLRAMLHEGLENSSYTSRKSQYAFFPTARLVTEDRGDK